MPYIRFTLVVNRDIGHSRYVGTSCQQLGMPYIRFTLVVNRDSEHPI